MQTVSVIIPTYNRAHCIERAIRSVLNQKGQGIIFDIVEILVMDDGSTDDTEAVVRGIADPRVIYHLLPVNGGAGKARNEGANLARGEWIAFQDSDDEWHPDKLQKQFALAAEHPEYDMIYCGLHSELETGENWDFVPDESGDMFDRLAERNYIGAPVMLIRKDAWDQTGGFDPNLLALEDWDLALRFSDSHLIGCVAENLCTAYASLSGVSANYANSYAAHCQLFLNNRPLLQKHGVFEKALEALLLRANRAGMLQPVAKMLESVLSHEI